MANDAGTILWDNLQPIQVDRKRDVVLLGPAAIPDMAFTVRAVVELDGGKGARIVGRPYGLQTLVSDVRFRQPVLVKLATLLRNRELVALKARGSPDPEIQVISIQGKILPSHSGAPVIDDLGTIVGVADGSLEEGFADIAWAIPLSTVSWVGVPPEGGLADFDGLESPDVFASDNSPYPHLPIRLEGSAHVQNAIMTTVVTVAEDGLVTGETTTKTEASVTGSCGSVFLALVDQTNKVVLNHTPGQYCVDGSLGRVFGGVTERVDRWQTRVSPGLLSEIYSVSLVHVEGGKDPGALFVENIRKVATIERRNE